MSERPLSKPMWTCPQCGRQFANPNQSHACSRHTLAEHLEGKSDSIIALYRQLEAMIQSMGPVIILPEKTRIAFQVRMSFAAVMLKQRWVDGHVVLARRVESPRFLRIESISPRNHVHTFRLSSPEEIDAELTAWIAEAYLVGQQRHLRSSGKEPSS
jgi:Domain of unknown function (DUF5655)